MNGFPLKIVTPDGLLFDGAAEALTVRTTTGDMGILAGHCNCVVPLGMGRAMVRIDGEKRHAVCSGGMLSAMNGHVTLVPTTFQWIETNDTKNTKASDERARS